MKCTCFRLSKAFFFLAANKGSQQMQQFVQQSLHKLLHLLAAVCKNWKKKKKSLCKNKGSAKTKAFTASGPSRDKVQDQWGMPGSPLRNLRVPAGMKEITEAKECGSKKALTTSDECDALPLTQGAWSLCCSYLVSEGPFQLVFRRDLAHSSWM